MNNDNAIGFLSIILGPMWSGKTSKLVEIYKQCTFCNINVLPINYIDDTRYGEGCDKMATHDERVIPCTKVKELKDISNICNDENNKKFMDAKVILINEGQFFSDIKDWVMCAVEKHKKHVYICGLDGDFKRNKFGELLDLIPVCDKVEKLSSICLVCKKRPAIFSHRTVKSKSSSQVLIGTTEYMPLCRECFTN